VGGIFSFVFFKDVMVLYSVHAGGGAGRLMAFNGPLWNSCKVRKLKGNGLFYAIFMVLCKVRKLRGNGLNL
jgi:hypothetical protein